MSEPPHCPRRRRHRGQRPGRRPHLRRPGGARRHGACRRTPCGHGPVVDGVEERVGDFPDPSFAAAVVEGADAVVTTVHPMGSDLETQHRIGVEGTTTLARAAAGAGVPLRARLHRCGLRPLARSGDVDESSALVGDDAGDYAVTKRDTDVALAGVDGHHPGAAATAGDPRRRRVLGLELAASRRRPRRRGGTSRRARPDLRVGPRRRPRGPRRRRRHRPDRASADARSGPGRRGVHRRQRGRRPGHACATTYGTVTGASASTPSGTTSPPGPVRSSPIAPTPGAGRRRSGWPQRSRRSPPGFEAPCTVEGGLAGRPGSGDRMRRHHGRVLGRRSPSSPSC